MKLLLLVLLGLALTYAEFNSEYFQESIIDIEDEPNIKVWEEFYEQEQTKISKYQNFKQYPETNEVESYDLDLARMLAAFSQASYCTKHKIQNWSCGKPCKAYPGMEDIHILKNSYLDDNHAFIGYYPMNNLIVIAFKGTISIRNWLEDFNGFMVKYPYCIGCKVHEGIYHGYLGLQDQIWEILPQLREKYPTARLVITGHSLGAALSTFCAADLVEKKINNFLWYNYGSPRIANESFTNWLQETFTQRLYRVTHHKDPIPHIGPREWGFHHLAQEIFYDGNSAPEEQHTFCNLSGEDPNCSDKYLLTALNMLNHLQYEGWNFLTNIAKCLII